MWESGRVPGTVLLALTWALQPGVTPRPIERGVSYTASRGPSRSSRFERGVGCASSTRPGPKAATGSSLPWAVSSPAGICDTTHQTEQIPPNQWRNASLHQYSAGGPPARAGPGPSDRFYCSPPLRHHPRFVPHPHIFPDLAAPRPCGVLPVLQVARPAATAATGGRAGLRSPPGALTRRRPCRGSELSSLASICV